MPVQQAPGISTAKSSPFSSVQATYKIGAVTYQVTAYYDDNGEALKDKVRRLLLDRIEKAHLAQKG